MYGYLSVLYNNGTRENLELLQTEPSNTYEEFGQRLKACRKTACGQKSNIVGYILRDVSFSIIEKWVLAPCYLPVDWKLGIRW